MRAVRQGAMHSRRARAGFTLVEMIFAVSITVLVFSIAIPFFRAQTRAVDAGAGRLDAFQSARYAVARIGDELRMAGGDIGQPVIVQAAPFAIAFNANRQGRMPATDPNASYWDDALDTLTTTSWPVARALALPTSSKTYPAVNYTDPAGAASQAETIQYFLHTDTSGTAELYNLFRRVNDGDSTLVTGNLYVPADSSFFFRYYTTGATGATSAIVNASLPIYWDDTLGRADSITAVQLRATGQYWDNQMRTGVYRHLYTTVKLRNAFQLLPRRCGVVPPTPDSLGVAVEYARGGAKRNVRLDWSAVAADGAAPNDVRQYLLYRRLSDSTTWTPIGDTPARRAATYRYQDFDLPVIAGTYVYGLAARDCSGLSAVRTGTATVTLP